MIYLTKNKTWNINNDYNIDKLLYLLVDRCKVHSISSGMFWGNSEEQWHRDYNLPALILHDGFVYWYKNGMLISHKMA